MLLGDEFRGRIKFGETCFLGRNECRARSPYHDATQQGIIVVMCGILLAFPLRLFCSMFMFIGC